MRNAICRNSIYKVAINRDGYLIVRRAVTLLGGNANTLLAP